MSYRDFSRISSWDYLDRDSLEELHGDHNPEGCKVICQCMGCLYIRARIEILERKAFRIPRTHPGLKPLPIPEIH